MSRLRAILVDDEELARRGLALRLADIAEVEIVAQCANGSEALEAVSKLSPDLMFLDIQMPGMSGFDVVCELQADSMPMIVFVTAFDEYAVQAFRIHALDYLLKPIDEQHLQETVSHALTLHQRRDATLTKEKLMELISGMEGNERSQASLPDNHNDNDSSEDTRNWPSRLTIKDGNDFHFVPVADIQWVDAAGDYMCVHANGTTHIMRITMKQLEASLDPALFSRVHRSTLVNTHCIAGAQAVDNGEYLLTMIDGRQLKVSRSYAPKIKDLLLS